MLLSTNKQKWNGLVSNIEDPKDICLICCMRTNPCQHLLIVLKANSLVIWGDGVGGRIISVQYECGV